MFARRRIAALGAEFLGTGILAFLVLTVSRSNIGLPYFVAIAAGVAVTLFGLALARDVQLNPAYTLALWTARRQGLVKTVAFIVVQLLGGMAAYLLYKFFQETGVVQGLPDDFRREILVAEAVGAFVFAFGASAALYRQAHPLVRYVVTGGAYTLGVMVASVAAAGFINPAVAAASNALVWSTYVLGPVLGAIMGVNLYGLLFADRESQTVADAGVGEERVTASAVVVETAPVVKEADKASAKSAAKTKAVKATKPAKADKGRTKSGGRKKK